MHNHTVLAPRKKSKSKTNIPLLKHRLFFAMSILVILSATAMYSVEARSTADSPAHTAPPAPPLPSPVVTPLTSSSPLVIVTPGSVSVMSIGSTFTVQIQVKNMAPFVGWDIMVYADNFALNATSLSIAGNDFAVNASSGTPFEIVHCVNNRGTGCTSLDGPGIVHSTYANSATLSGSGLLFTITYQVLGTYGYSPISLENTGISDPNSRTPVPHSTTDAIYGVFSFAGGGGAVMPRK